MDNNAGTDVAEIKEEWGAEFSDLDCAVDWEVMDESLHHTSRWCNHMIKILRHDSGLMIAIEFATNVGDGDSASAYPDKWYEVEPYEVIETRYRKKG